MRRRFVARNFVSLVVSLAFFFSFFASLDSVLAAGESATAPSDTTVFSNQNNLALSDAFQVSGFAENANLLVSITVSGSTAAKVNLPTTTGLTLESGYLSWTNTSQINFTGNQANINTALDAMTLNSGGTNGNATLEIEVSEKVNNTAFYDGHLYEFVQGNISYLNARSAARLRTINGVNGYLVTITSDAEHNFVLSKIQGAYNIWIALSDRTIEGDWVLDPYDGSPEQGMLVWRGIWNGSAQGGNYAKWCGGEPNNSGNEDAAVTKWNGGNCWNDLPDSWSSVGGYVAEYNMPSSVVVSDSMVITVESRTLNTPTNLAVSFSGTTANLTWTAPAESNTPVERYEVSWSTDNFASGFAIASQTTSASIPNLVRGTTYQFRVRADNDTYSTYSSYTSSVSATAPQEGNTITFSFNPTTITQNVQINTANKTTLLATAKATSIEGSPDLFFVGIELRGVGGGLIYSHNTGWVNLTNSYQDITLTVTASGVGAEAWALVDSVTLVLGGDDAEFWAGNYGPRVESASLKLDGTELMSNVEFANGTQYWESSVGWQSCHATQGNKPCASAGLYVAPTTTVPTTTVPPTTVPPITIAPTTVPPTTEPPTTTTTSSTTTTTTTTVYVPTVTTTTEYVTTTTSSTVVETTTTTTEPEPEDTTTTQPENTVPETTVPEETQPEEEENETNTTIAIPDDEGEKEDKEDSTPDSTDTTATTEPQSSGGDEPDDGEISQESTDPIQESSDETKEEEKALETITETTKSPSELTEEDKEVIVAAVAAILAGGVDTSVATELASNPAVLASVDVEQAQEIFAAIDEGELTKEQGEAIVAAIQEATDEVRDTFEEQVNVFAGAFDNYVPLGSTIDVGTRRAVIAVAALQQVAMGATAVAATSGNIGGQSSSSANQNDAARKEEEEEEEEAGELEGTDLRPWLDTISIWIHVNGIRKFNMKKFIQKFWYETLALGFTISSSIILWVTLSGFTRNVAIIATILAFAAHYYLVMWKQQNGSDE